MTEHLSESQQRAIRNIDAYLADILNLATTAIIEGKPERLPQYAHILCDARNEIRNID